MKSLLATVVLVSSLAWAGKPARHAKPAEPAEPHHFEKVALSKLTVAQVRGDDALVEGPEGETVLVHAGDLLGTESYRVQRVGGGCVFLKGKRGSLSLCGGDDTGAIPRS